MFPHSFLFLQYLLDDIFLSDLYKGMCNHCAMHWDFLQAYEFILVIITVEIIPQSTDNYLVIFFVRKFPESTYFFLVINCVRKFPHFIDFVFRYHFFLEISRVY